MEHGDIDNAAPSRLLVVFEGLIGISIPYDERPEPPAPARRMFRRRAREAHDVLRPEHFAINPLARDAIWREQHHTGWHVDVVTFLGDRFGSELAEWLPGQMIFAPVISRVPYVLARELAYRHDIRAVYFPSAAHQWTFGQRGRHCPPDRAAATIGRV
jgi:hypothetical protein